MSKSSLPLAICIFAIAFSQTLFGLAHADEAGEISFQDRTEILDLISRYSHTWDGKDSDSWAALFANSAISQYYSAGEFVIEASSNAERLRGAKARHARFAENSIQTRHLQTNSILTRQPDGSVSGETVFSVTWQYASEERPRLMHTGVYLDVFTNTPSGWRFSRREVRVDNK